MMRPYTAAHADAGVATPRRPPLTVAIAPLTNAPGNPDCPAPEGRLAQIDYGAAHRQCMGDPGRLVVGLPTLGEPALRELWQTPAPVVTGWQDGIGYGQGPDLLFAHLLLLDPGTVDLADLAERAYTQLLAFIRARGFPHPLRMWNVLARVHDCNRGLERYRAFCVGRDRALRLAGLAPTRFPAATAVGAATSGLLVYLFAGRTPGLAVENPRQVSAWRYPARYGPRPPSFARGLHYPANGSGCFFISGTASVVGHRSLHPGDLGRQLRETLNNLEVLTDAAGVGRPSLLKVFLRDPRHLEQTRAGLRHWAPTGTPVLYLHAQVCRAELEIEIEGVCARPPDASQ